MKNGVREREGQGEVMDIVMDMDTDMVATGMDMIKDMDMGGMVVRQFRASSVADIICEN
jgi:hypothetical protein